MSRSFASVAEKKEFEKRKAEELCVWVNAHLNEPIELKDLVVTSGLTHFEILKIFSIHFRTTPMQWIRQQRDLQSQSRYVEKTLNSGTGTTVRIPNHLRKK